MQQFLFIIVVLAALWLLLIRPQRRRQTKQKTLLESLSPGDEVVTAGGLFGTVRSLQDDEVRLEIAPGTEVRIARRAVAGIVSDETEPRADEPESAAEPDAEHEANLPG